jgi:hypothetical protein
MVSCVVPRRIVVVVVEREEGTHNPSGKNFVWALRKE